MTDNKNKIQEFFSIPKITSFAVMKNEGSILYSTDLNGGFNIWKLDLNHQEPYQVATIGQPAKINIENHNQELAYLTFDNDGDENTQLYTMSMADGSIKPLVINKGFRNYFIGQSTKDSSIYYQTSKGNEVGFNFYQRNLIDNTDILISAGKNQPEGILDISPDETKFAINKSFGNTHQQLLILANNEKEIIVPVDTTITDCIVEDAKFINDHELYFITNYNDEFNYLMHYNLTTKELTKTVALQDCDITAFKYQKSSNKLFLIVASSLEDHLYHYDINEKTLTKINLPLTTISSIQVMQDTNTIYLMASSSTTPNNIYQLINGELIQLTKNSLASINQLELSQPSVIKYPSFDGLEIEGLLFKANQVNDKQHLIFWPHGGPNSAETKSFRALFQLLTYFGYSIFAPNFRGSTRKGISFTKMVEGDWGTGPRLDCVAGLDYLIENNLASQDKIFLMGGSYGGYMALLLTARHQEYFKATVDIFGVSNLLTFIESVPPSWKPYMKRWVGDIDSEKQKLIDHSPITYVKNIKNPLLIIQGANDPRVVKAESDQIVATLQAQGNVVEYVVFDNEGHGFMHKENEVTAYMAILNFFDSLLNS